MCVVVSCIILSICLLLVTQHRIAMLTCADAPCVNHFADEDASVADLTRMSCFDNDIHGRLNELVTADNGDGHALNDIRRILHATIDSFLTALADSVYVMIFKPVDVRTEERFFDLLKLCFPDNCFNLLHLFKE